MPRPRSDKHSCVRAVWERRIKWLQVARHPPERDEEGPSSPSCRPLGLGLEELQRTVAQVALHIRVDRAVRIQNAVADQRPHLLLEAVSREGALSSQPSGEYTAFFQSHSHASLSESPRGLPSLQRAAPARSSLRKSDLSWCEVMAFLHHSRLAAASRDTTSPRAVDASIRLARPSLASRKSTCTAGSASSAVQISFPSAARLA